jgi:hypothetical protein
MAEQVNNRLEIELRDKRLLDPVDDFQLGGALLRHGEQAAESSFENYIGTIERPAAREGKVLYARA